MVVGMTLPGKPSPPLMPCPFSPCEAERVLIVHRTDPADETKRVRVYPLHDVEGPASWFGRCPASMLIAPNLSSAGMGVLRDAMDQYRRMVNERYQAALEKEQRVSEAIHDLIDHPERYPDRVRPAPPSVEDYFPGRPADAPEPGAGEQPTAPVPAGVWGVRHGGANMSTREQHLALVNAAIENAADIQELAAGVTESLDRLDGYVAAMVQKQQAGAALMIGAVGAGGNLPIDAAEAITGFSRIGELISELRASAALLRMRDESVVRVAGKTAASATIYRAAI